MFFLLGTNENATATVKKGGLFDDLQDLLVDQSTGQKISLTRNTFQSGSTNPTKIPLNEMKNSSSSKSLESEISFPTVTLESIRPSSINPPIPLKLTQTTGLQCVLHIARDSPRPDLIVSVLTITNTNTTKTINHFHFEANVPKVNPIFPNSPSFSSHTFSLEEYAN